MAKKGKFLLILILLLLLSPVTYGMTYLGLGHEGSQVRELQENLSSLGYSLEVDGIFGLDTEKVVMDFQREQGLIVDGIVGPETRELLEQSIDPLLHKVIGGDTLFCLAIKYGTTVEAIKGVNQLTHDMIYIGDQLIIPHASQKTFTYHVEAGDTLTCIAEKYSTSIKAIKEENQLQTDRIYEGQQLTIPLLGAGGGLGNYVLKEITHVVKSGETLSGISLQYDLSVNIIKEINHLKGDLIKVGQKLFIPNQSSNAQKIITKGSLLWPVEGPISSPFGWRNHPVYNYRQFHGGIDIVVPSGTPVRAAASGIIVGSQWEGGFGNTVLIDHGYDMKTFYGHNSRIVVSVGQRVARGEIIAYSGNTGISTGPHLDFRIFINGEVVDPLKWLP